MYDLSIKWLLEETENINYTWRISEKNDKEKTTKQSILGGFKGMIREKFIMLNNFNDWYL